MPDAHVTLLAEGLIERAPTAEASGNKGGTGVKATVSESDCVGCGLCASICPAVFEMDGDTNVAKVMVAVVPEEEAGPCREAAEDCPVEAIKLEGQEARKHGMVGGR